MLLLNTIFQRSLRGQWLQPSISSREDPRPDSVTILLSGIILKLSLLQFQLYFCRILGWILTIVYGTEMCIIIRVAGFPRLNGVREVRTLRHLQPTF
jgi:hypothetical protein